MPKIIRRLCKILYIYNKKWERGFELFGTKCILNPWLQISNFFSVLKFVVAAARTAVCEGMKYRTRRKKMTFMPTLQLKGFFLLFYEQAQISGKNLFWSDFVARFYIIRRLNDKDWIFLCIWGGNVSTPNSRISLKVATLMSIVLFISVTRAKNVSGVERRSKLVKNNSDELEHTKRERVGALGYFSCNWAIK